MAVHAACESRVHVGWAKTRAVGIQAYLPWNHFVNMALISRMCMYGLLLLGMKAADARVPHLVGGGGRQVQAFRHLRAAQRPTAGLRREY